MLLINAVNGVHNSNLWDQVVNWRNTFVIKKTLPITYDTSTYDIFVLCISVLLHHSTARQSTKTAAPKPQGYREDNTAGKWTIYYSIWMLT